MKTILSIVFVFAAAMASANDAVLTALASAPGTKAAPTPITGANHWTIRTDVYQGRDGSGFQVVATLTIDGQSFFLARQTGPETSRQNMPSFADFKAHILARLDAQYATAQTKGITVTSGSMTITLAATDADQNAFTRLLGLLNTAPMPPNIDLADVKGVPHSVAVTDVYTLLGSYGQQAAALWANYVSVKAAVKAAATFDQLAP